MKEHNIDLLWEEGKKKEILIDSYSCTHSEVNFRNDKINAVVDCSKTTQEL